jgi:hypothetical protein
MTTFEAKPAKVGRRPQPTSGHPAAEGAALPRTIHEEAPAESARWGAATRRASGLHRKRVMRHAEEHPGRATQQPYTRSRSPAALHE